MGAETVTLFYGLQLLVSQGLRCRRVSPLHGIKRGWEHESGGPAEVTDHGGLCPRRDSVPRAAVLQRVSALYRAPLASERPSPVILPWHHARRVPGQGHHCRLSNPTTVSRTSFLLHKWAGFRYFVTITENRPFSLDLSQRPRSDLTPSSATAGTSLCSHFAFVIVPQGFRPSRYKSAQQSPPIPPWMAAIQY